ncbi:hypothetical protein KCU61_g301, partial [Aureobasidium melanogenum]
MRSVLFDSMSKDQEGKGGEVLDKQAATPSDAGLILHKRSLGSERSGEPARQTCCMRVDYTIEECLSAQDRQLCVDVLVKFGNRRVPETQRREARQLSTPRVRRTNRLSLHFWKLTCRIRTIRGTATVMSVVLVPCLRAAACGSLLLLVQILRIAAYHSWCQRPLPWHFDISGEGIEGFLFCRWTDPGQVFPYIIKYHVCGEKESYEVVKVIKVFASGFFPSPKLHVIPTSALEVRRNKGRTAAAHNNFHVNQYLQRRQKRLLLFDKLSLPRS